MQASDISYMAIPGIIRDWKQQAITRSVLYLMKFKEDIKSKTNKREFVMARNIVGYMLAKNGFTHTQIADQVGRNRTTVIHGLKSLKNEMQTDFDVRNEVKRIEIFLNQK